MRKAHAHRHRRQATRTREVERARRIQVSIEAEERRRAEEDARWARERHRLWGMPLTPCVGWEGMMLANAAASRTFLGEGVTDAPPIEGSERGWVTNLGS
ncbi:hypothetical protein LPC10_17815 [Methylorubrum sp. B1-46]|uniref:hypothetical protein n=1 Tax=Methylorubrum TaxID=2282523 RepID=UPI001E35E1ED|nr:MULTISPECIES: hypothetical protein [Methylorubrum]MCG5246850.1 hypothetical protein [Methylorubrum extorquens]UGB24788.1 hypothetical protein LPC10_17815 [Methylorubrum sp. B1-46]